MAALAYLITWRTYGAWLTGDPRGSVTRRNNVFGDPLTEPDPRRRRGAEKMMREPAFVLSPAARDVCKQTIREHCHIRAWTPHALHVGALHVHAVLTCPCEPEIAMNQLKSWCTRRLREAGLIDGRTRIWATHGSTPHLFNADQLAQKIDYVNGQ